MYTNLNLIYSTLTDENLRWLTIDQALTDVAEFVTYVRSTYTDETAQVVVAGTMYGGSLAAWFRQKYPHLAVGAWASSAPAVAKIDNFEYKEIAGEVYRRIGGDACYNALETAVTQLDELVQAGEKEQLATLLHLCPESTVNELHESWFMSSVFTEFFSGLQLIDM